MLQSLQAWGFLVPREIADDKSNTSPLINLFIAFHLFGLFGTILMVLTVVFSRSTSRHPTWFSFAFSWIISTVSYSLLFFAGRLSRNTQPEHDLCLVQSVMIYSAPPLTAATTLALVIQIWFLVHSVVTSPLRYNKGIRLSPIWSASLLVAPYLLYTAVVVSTLVFGINTPSTVRKTRTGMYCTFANRVPGRISTILVALIMIPTVVLETLICIALHKRWQLFKYQKGSLSIILRVITFTFFGILAIALSLVFFVKIHHGPELNIIISLLPLAAVLTFATQGDLLRVWMFWRRGSDTDRQTISSNPDADARPQARKHFAC